MCSGESGAGKTEATKQCLNYLAYLAGSATGIQTKILKASPVLEAWGNAKTLRNNNSSRFGKFIEIWFDKQCSITGSSNTTYILEKSRVVFQEKDERNYHVFYQLLSGATPSLLQELELSELAEHPERSDLINQSGCIRIENVDDGADFREANEAFVEIGFTAEEQKSLYTIIAGILLFGNIKYASTPDNPDESLIPPEFSTWLEKGARQFGLEPEYVKKALLYKSIRSGGANSKRSSVAYACYTTAAAYENRNALLKEIYRRCFDWIVAKINSLMENDASLAVNMIGILDIFGFEIFQKVNIYFTSCCKLFVLSLILLICTKSDICVSFHFFVPAGVEFIRAAVH
jgi:myosin heavy subunit